MTNIDNWAWHSASRMSFHTKGYHRRENDYNRCKTDYLEAREFKLLWLDRNAQNVIYINNKKHKIPYNSIVCPSEMNRELDYRDIHVLHTDPQYERQKLKIKNDNTSTWVQIAENQKRSTAIIMYEPNCLSIM